MNYQLRVDRMIGIQIDAIRAGAVKLMLRARQFVVATRIETPPSMGTDSRDQEEPERYREDLRMDMSDWLDPYQDREVSVPEYPFQDFNYGP
mgnify:CR=1 FL=1